MITVNLSLPNLWSDFLEPEADPPTVEQRQAAALMHCFATAVAHAHTTQGASHWGGSDLARPVCVQAICSDGVYFDFVAFQLNTLHVPGAGAVPSERRNLAWVDGTHRLFHKRIPQRSMLRNTRYSQLDMGVFARMAACYYWGMLSGEVANQMLSSAPAQLPTAVAGGGE